MESIYSICFGVQLMEEAIKAFSHPVVDSLRTKVSSEITLKQSSLEVKLYDFKGNYVLQDLKIGQEYMFPGLLLTAHPLDKRVQIESIYVKPEFKGFGIGTAFVYEMMNCAKRSGYERMRVVADVETNAQAYWRRVHGFESVDEVMPLVLEREL